MAPRSPLPSSASMPCVSPRRCHRGPAPSHARRGEGASRCGRGRARTRWPKSSSAPRWRSSSARRRSCFSPKSRASRLERSIGLRREALVHAAGRPALEASIEQALGLYVQFSEGMEPPKRCAPGTRPRGGARRRRVARGALQAARSPSLQRREGGRTRFRREGVRARGEDRRSAANRPRVVLPRAHPRLVGRLDEARSILEHLHDEWGKRDERTAAQASWYLGIVEVRACRSACAGARGTCARAADPVFARGGIRRTTSRSPSSRRIAATSTRHANSLPPAAGSPNAQGAARRARRDVRDRRAVERRCGGRPRALRVRRPDRDEGGVVDPGIRWWRDEHVEALLSSAGSTMRSMSSPSSSRWRPVSSGRGRWPR